MSIPKDGQQNGCGDGSEKKRNLGEGRLEMLIRQLKGAQAEIARLREELKEYEDACKAAADESCEGNVRHCTCVGLLRHEVHALREENERLQNRSFQCCFCGANCQTFSGLQIHSAKCESHPQFKEKERLRKDAERLDWVEENLKRIRRRIRTSDSAQMTIEWYADGVTEFVRAATLRAAIDAAKEAE